MKPSDLLRRNIGTEKADQAMGTFHKWMRGMDEFKKSIPISKSNRIDGYDYKAQTTTVDGAGGFMIPLEIKDEVCRVIHDYGYILANVTKVLVPAGGSIRINELKTMTPAKMTCGECVDLGEIATELEAPETLNPCFVGGVFTASNELVSYPGVNFSALFFDWMVDTIVEVQEFLIFQAAKASGANHDGILVDPLVHSAPDFVATASNSMTKFMKDAITHYPHLANPYDTLIVGPPTIHVIETGATRSIVAFQCSPGRDAPKFNCYSMIGTTALHMGADDWLTMFDARHVVMATDQNVVLDINPYTNFNKNCSLIKVGQFFDFILCHPQNMTKAKVVHATP